MKTSNILEKVTKKLQKSQACTLAVEEISELIIEVTNTLTGNFNYDDFCEEVADVRIMTRLVEVTFGIKRKDIRKQKKKHKDSFKEYCKEHDRVFNLQSCIYELANLQKTICKKSRGRHNKKDILNAIVGVELSIKYAADEKLIKEEDCKKWETKKIKRMQKRIRSNHII